MTHDLGDFINPAIAFEEAIEEGLLSKDKNASNFAGLYMYMHSKHGQHFFKNIVTRQYINTKGN